MIRKITIMLSMLSFALTAGAQGGKATALTVSGTVADSLTHEGEPYATVRIMRTDTAGTVLKTVLTDAAGRFSIRLEERGEMMVSVSSMGHGTLTQRFTAADGVRTVPLDTIFLAAGGHELQQVVVKAQKPLVKADIDKIAYSIEDDPDAQTNTVLEMLRKVPMVTVDGEDNIKVNGKSSFKVYVNGRPNKMMSDNPKDVLKSLPANTVKRIEVITNPGPKYDAEGVGGVINIITTEGRGLEGYTVTTSANGFNLGGSAGIFGTVKKGGLTVSARYNYAHVSRDGIRNGSTMKALGSLTGASSDVVSENNNDMRVNFHSASMEASYEIDTLRLVSAEFSMWGNNLHSNTANTTSATSPLTGAGLYSYGQTNRSATSYFSINGGVDYQRGFAGVKDRLLTLSYRLSTTPSTSDMTVNYEDMKTTEDWRNFTDALRNQWTDGSHGTTEHTAQADFTTPIAKIHTLETGVKYIYRNNRSEDDRYERAVGTEEAFAPDADHSSHYRHRNDIMAAYAGYGLNVGRWSGRLGLRYEHTTQKVSYLLGRGSDFRKDFDDFVPSASIGYKLTDMQNLRLGYNMRIYRPGISYLNPYFDDKNPVAISQGNPDLVSEKTHSFDVTYSNFTQKVNMNFSAGYSFANNSIESFSEMVEDVTLVPLGLQNPAGKNVMYTTYRNIGHTRSVDLSAYVNWNVTSALRVYANLSGSYSRYDDGQGLKNDGWDMFTYGGAQLSLPKDWRFSFNIFYMTPPVSLQGKDGNWMDYGLNVSKSFMKKRLTVSAFAQTPFKEYWRNSSFVETPTFRSDDWSMNPVRRYGVSVSFRIGELKAGVKKANRSISNDDVKSGEDKKSSF